MVLGMLLPDMVKNYRKDWALHPGKRAGQLEVYPKSGSMLRGWELHLETDRRFHSSRFFRQHSSTLRKEIAAIITRGPFRPFFLAHIALELLLDNLLLNDTKVNADLLYRRLSECDPGEIVRFLEITRADNAASFINWYDHFLQTPYLYDYADIEKLSYILDRIGQRVWRDGFSSGESAALTKLLTGYRLRLAGNYMIIFEEVAGFLR